MMNIIEHIYYDWLKMVAYPDQQERDIHSNLIDKLYYTKFVATMVKDENRTQDILSFRRRFAYEFGVDQNVASESLIMEPNMLELMISLSFYCYENITYSEDAESGISIWFKDMLMNLGLNNMDNYHYDEMYIQEVLDNFMSRNYEPNGKGSLFVTNDRNVDMRSIEIWYQLNKYVNEKIINY